MASPLRAFVLRRRQEPVKKLPLGLSSVQYQGTHIPLSAGRGESCKSLLPSCDATSQLCFIRLPLRIRCLRQHVAQQFCALSLSENDLVTITPRQRARWALRRG